MRSRPENNVVEMVSSYTPGIKFLFGLVSAAALLFHTGIAQKIRREPSSYHQRHYGAETVDCQNVSEIVFVSFFPCLRNDKFTASEKLSECDLLAEAAAHLAVERVNQDPDILPNITLKLYPIYTPNSKESLTVSSSYSILLFTCMYINIHTCQYSYAVSDAFQGSLP